MSLSRRSESLNRRSDFRQLGKSPLFVSPVAMGCWPIAGITSLDVNPEDSRATLQAAFESGINFFDTAYSYGFEGESERLVGEVLTDHQEEVVIATKGGLVWDGNRQRQHQAKPAAILEQFEASQDRLQMECIDLYYLHAPDPQVPVAETATAFAELSERGGVRAVGVSNVTLDQLRAFQAVCPVTAVQPHYNMLQREIEGDLLPYCMQQQISAIVYWPLMKGLLAGKLARDHHFAPGDGRTKYPMFQGEEWEKNQDFVDVLRQIATECERTVTEVVVNWTIHQPGISVALCGAKRAYQIKESAQAFGWQLSAEHQARIEAAIAARGTPVTRAAV